MLKEFTTGLFPIVILAFIVGDMIVFCNEWLNGSINLDFCLGILFSNIRILIPVVFVKVMLYYKFKYDKDDEYEE